MNYDIILHLKILASLSACVFFLNLLTFNSDRIVYLVCDQVLSLTQCALIGNHLRRNQVVNEKVTAKFHCPGSIFWP